MLRLSVMCLGIVIPVCLAGCTPVSPLNATSTPPVSSPSPQAGSTSTALSSNSPPPSAPASASPSPSPAAFDVEQSIDLALPALSGITETAVLESIPLADAPPVTTTEELAKTDTVIGVLDVEQSTQNLKADEYTVQVSQQKVEFVNPEGAIVFSTPGVIQRLDQALGSPETSITLNQVCYSWSQVQVCVDLSLQETLQTIGTNKIIPKMNRAVDQLTRRHLLERRQINVTKTMPVVVDRSADETKADILVAPITKPSKKPEEITDGMTIGAIDIIDPVKLQNRAVAVGAYRVQAFQGSDGSWRLRLENGRNVPIHIPAQMSKEAAPPGAGDEPFVTLDSVCMWIPTTSDWRSICIL